MSTGVPALTISSAAGICDTILPSGSAGCGEAWPSVRFLSRSAFSASARFMPVMLGTLTLPEPTAIRTVTCSPFSALEPSAGVWPITVPAGTLSSSFSFWFGSSLRSALVSFSSALNADGSPTTFGTSTFCGRLRKSRNSSSASSSSTGISHHGSHGFCGTSPGSAAAGRSAPRGTAAAAEHPLAGLGVEGAHLRPLHLRRAHLRHPHVQAARADGHAGRVQLRLEDARRVHARDLRRAPPVPLLLRRRALLLQDVGADGLGRGALGGLLAGDRLDLQAALLRAPDPDLLGRADLHLRGHGRCPRGSPAAGG